MQPTSFDNNHFITWFQAKKNQTVLRGQDTPKKEFLKLSRSSYATPRMGIPIPSPFSSLPLE